jgi:hypothetical protein
MAHNAGASPLVRRQRLQELPEGQQTEPSTLSAPALEERPPQEPHSRTCKGACRHAISAPGAPAAASQLHRAASCRLARLLREALHGTHLLAAGAAGWAGGRRRAGGRGAAAGAAGAAGGTSAAVPGSTRACAGKTLAIPLRLALAAGACSTGCRGGASIVSMQHLASLAAVLSSWPLASSNLP